MNPARIASSDRKSYRNAMVCDTPYLQNEFSDHDFFYVFNIILSFSTCSQSIKKSVRGKFWPRTSLNNLILGSNILFGFSPD